MDNEKIENAINNAIANINVDDLTVKKEQIDVIKQELINSSKSDNVSLLSKLIEISENKGVSKVRGK